MSCSNKYPRTRQPVALQQPAYWAVPSGSNPAGAVSVSYAGAAGTQVQTLGQVQV